MLRNPEYALLRVRKADSVFRFWSSLEVSGVCADRQIRTQTLSTEGTSASINRIIITGLIIYFILYYLNLQFYVLFIISI